MEPLGRRRWRSKIGLGPGVDAVGSQSLEFRKQQLHLLFKVLPGLRDAIKIPRFAEIIHPFCGLKRAVGGEQTHGALDAVRQLARCDEVAGLQTVDYLPAEIRILVEEELRHFPQQVGHAFDSVESFPPIDDRSCQLIRRDSAGRGF